jgi:uncharacterized protein (DUF427 family)
VTRAARPVRVEPGPGQESVWDYPRPPRVEAARQVLRVELARETLAETVHGLRVLETGSPPAYYFPPDDVRTDLLEPSPVRTICEWKGVARHWNARVGERLVEEAGWSYRDPKPGYEPIAGYFAFYAGKMDACWVGTEKVIPQPGRFYGGWITSRVVGPFKGAEGTGHW